MNKRDKGICTYDGTLEKRKGKKEIERETNLEVYIKARRSFKKIMQKYKKRRLNSTPLEEKQME